MNRKFIRLVTENPQGNYQYLHNMTVIKDKEVFLRDFEGEGDLSLVDYCKRECMERCNTDIDASVEEFGEHMDCGCPITLIYHMAVGHAELRNRLGQYESSGLSPEDLKERTCEWSEDDEGNWSCSKCTAVVIFAEDGPSENRMSFCPECGRKIINISLWKDELLEDEHE
ncbi:hypothetical protein [Desulfosporosinus youngiae]|uniref:Uncharacterized protein n=1 Tax=Desulfosporosinus youngiae DSM 17734 TaxID=768710 RepID=H5Y260_9FIRM|nr:hypothetical protein [Desulfosporosinus youngiae]EHQ88258.1 hypothetical protein DesyoDRAFT_1088 [Desulfosporosinus youngiae DSM 17734]